MTRAPENLLAVRKLVLDHLDDSPGPDDLQPAEVGIVGDANHRGGYHCGSNRVVSGDYSVVESPRDSKGLTLDAAALDIGLFSVKTPTGTHDLYSFNRWCVAQCAANAPDTRDIREIIYSPDGKVVRRWDRLRRRSGGDSSHLWHTHLSFFRDAIEANRDQTPLFRRYLTEIGLIDVALDPAERETLNTIRAEVRAILTMSLTPDNALAWWIRSAADRDDAVLRTKYPNWATAAAPGRTQLAALMAGMGGDEVDEDAIVAGILAHLTPDRIAAAIPPAQTQAVADELARRLMER